jgi:ribosome-binding protein aMBF1 (putative translation factor)
LKKRYGYNTPGNKAQEQTGNILPFHGWQISCVQRSDLSQYLGSIVRKHRKLAKTTQEQLSERADIDVRMLRLIETKGQNFSISVAECLAQALGVPLSQMTREAEDLRRKNRQLKIP